MAIGSQLVVSAIGGGEILRGRFLEKSGEALTVYTAAGEPLEEVFMRLTFEEIEARFRGAPGATGLEGPPGKDGATGATGPAGPPARKRL